MGHVKYSSLGALKYIVDWEICHHKEEYYVDKNRKVQGLYRGYDRELKLVEEGQYEDNKKVGEWKWYENGILQSTYRYVNDERHGLQETFYYDGSVESEWYSVKGVDEGDCKCYFAPDVECVRSDRLESQYKYRNGVLQGQATHYYPNGKVKEILFYDGGKVIKSKKFDITGNLMGESNTHKSDTSKAR